MTGLWVGMGGAAVVELLVVMSVGRRVVTVLVVPALMVVEACVLTLAGSVEELKFVVSPDVVVEGLRVVVFPVWGAGLLPGEVFSGIELEVEMEVTVDKGVVVDAGVSGEVLVGFVSVVVVSTAVEISEVTVLVFAVPWLVCVVAGVGVVVKLPGCVVALVEVELLLV